MRTFLLGKLKEDLLAFGVFEAFAVLLEELVRITLASDADEQRLQIVHTGAQFFRPFGEDAVGSAFEEQEGRPRFEQRVLGGQFAIPPLERPQMLGQSAAPVRLDGVSV